MNDQHNPIEMPANTQAERIAKALAIAASSISDEGASHKEWTIDQIVRALTGCPVVDLPLGRSGTATYKGQGESAEYQQFVTDACAGVVDRSAWPVGLVP